MIVILDSNILVAAFAAKGICSDIYEYASINLTIALSEEIISECEKVFREKIKVSPRELKAITRNIKNSSTIFKPAEVNKNECRDPNDLHILGLGIKSKAKFIITGDQDLLILKSFKFSKICTTKEFWSYIINLTLKT